MIVLVPNGYKYSYKIFIRTKLQLEPFVLLGKLWSKMQRGIWCNRGWNMWRIRAWCVNLLPRGKLKVAQWRDTNGKLPIHFLHKFKHKINYGLCIRCIRGPLVDFVHRPWGITKRNVNFMYYNVSILTCHLFYVVILLFTCPQW